VDDIKSREIQLVNIDFWIRPFSGVRQPCTGTGDQYKWCFHDDTVYQYDRVLSPTCGGPQTGCSLMYFLTVNDFFQYDPYPSCPPTAGGQVTAACVINALNARLDWFDAQYFGQNAYYKVIGRPVVH